MFHLYFFFFNSFTVVLVSILLNTGVYAKVTLTSSSSNETFETNAWEGLLWHVPYLQRIAGVNSTSVPLIPLHAPIEDIYSPCDETTLTADVVTSVLGYFNINGTSTTTNWVAYIERDRIFEECKRVPVDYYYVSYAALKVQQMGGNGLIWGYPRNPELIKFTVPSNVDHLANTVKGIKVVTPTFMINRNDKENTSWLKQVIDGIKDKMMLWVTSMEMDINQI